MTICVLGLGYVGTVVATTLARRGHPVVGVDIDADKVHLLERGRASCAEPGLDDAIVRAGAALTASTDVQAALTEAHEILVCVGTPTGANGRPDLRSIDRVAEQIGTALRDAGPPMRTVVLRSTVPPGTTRTRVLPAIEATSGRRHGDGWTLLVSPEFLREGSALADMQAPPQTVIGARDPSDAAAYLARLGEATGPVEIVPFETAELLKYATNAFHGLKVAFANEVGALAHAVGSDGRQVMDLLCRDRTLNISTAYLRPGEPFGGSCLPKDLRALGRLAVDRGLTVPLTTSVLPANAAQLQRLVDAIVRTDVRRVGLVGLAFKAGTDDLRESPWVELVRRLRMDGMAVQIFDPHVDPTALRGKNRIFADLGLPDLADMLVTDLAALAEHSETLVLARRLEPSDTCPGPINIIDVADNHHMSDRSGYQAVPW
ncbi:MAG: nucleotide sugar dehydrogenase [Deltaproteobacteria bacterium]|nr:nucleotide sugar dehydrogenase [Deltaproteobacteria bacterium]